MGILSMIRKTCPTNHDNLDYTDETSTYDIQIHYPFGDLNERDQNPIFSIEQRTLS